MNRTEYKNNFGREHYERINLVVPKGMKDIIKALKRAIDSSFFIAKCVLHKTFNVLHKTRFSVLVTC